jgi:CRP/FNR family transcriptional regulator, cyclic AMP receptor protein
MDRFTALRRSSLLREFSDVGVRILAESCEERQVGRGTYAFRAGEPSTALCFIAKGTLQLQARDGGQPLGDLTGGDTLGNFALLSEGDHLLSAWAATDVELAVLQRDAFEALRKDKPQASIKLMLAITQDFGDRLRDARGPLREFLAWQVSKRQVDGGGR